MQHRRCAYCATWFNAHRASARTRRKFNDQYRRCCSRSCAVRLSAVERNPSSPWPNPAKVCSPCAWCGRPTPTPRNIYCSRACNEIAVDPRRKRSTPVGYADCRECGALYITRSVGGPAKKYCSDACLDRSYHRTRRHRERAVGVRSSDFTLREVADRDGWRCHLCGKAVPDRPSKSRPLDATLDHLIPISAGGPHTLDNVALAHHQCNSQRGDTGIAQLRLTG